MNQVNSPVKPSGGNSVVNRQSSFNDDYRSRRHPRNKTFNGPERRGDKSSRGDSTYRRRRDDVSNRDDSTSRGATSSRGERSDSRSTSSRNESRESRPRDRDTSERSDRKRDRSVQASSLTVDLDEAEEDDDYSRSSDDSQSD